ncbi:MAG: general secretion pathway protein GspK [Burkholderiales bacterium]|nr:general secretion pathway protein GspK [Burkholderiales bacterium]
MTVVVTAVLTVIVSYFAERIDAARQFAGRQADASEALLQMSDDRADMLFRMATGVVSVQGLGSPEHLLRLDNRAYVTHNAQLQLQDAAGLFSFRFPSPDGMGRLLTACGVSKELFPQLIDVFLDYTDTNSGGLKRLHGATKEDYAAAGLPPPAGRPLVSPLELRSMLIWHDLPDDKYRCIIQHSTTAVGQINVNTADEIVLQTIQGVDAKGAKALIERRLAEQITDSAVIGLVNGEDAVSLGFSVNTFPSRTLRITQSSPLIGWRLQYEVTMTAYDPHAPWRIDAFRREPVDVAQAGVLAPKPLPPFDTIDTKNDSVLPASL